jgi:hypothetical protein
MKKVTLICFWAICFAFVAQAQENTVSTDMVELKGKTVKLKVGQLAYAQYKINGSTGVHGEAKSENETILAPQKMEAPQKIEAPEPESDGETKTVEFIKGDDMNYMVMFRAVKKGKTNVIVKEMFRGEVKSTRKIQVIVQ